MWHTDRFFEYTNNDFCWHTHIHTAPIIYKSSLSSSSWLGDRPLDNRVPVQRRWGELWRSGNHPWSAQVSNYHCNHFKAIAIITIITHPSTFPPQFRTFEAASSQSFGGGNVLNKKTVYSRRGEPNVPGKRKGNPFKMRCRISWESHFLWVKGWIWELKESHLRKNMKSCFTIVLAVY